MERVAKRLGFSRASSYQRYEDDEKFTKPYLPRELGEKLAKVFTGLGSPPITSAEVMALCGGSVITLPLQSATSRLVEVIAVVEAGAWREEVEIPKEEREVYPLPPLPGFENSTVYGLRVRGSSMNLIFPDKCIVYFVSASDLPPSEGSYVVVRAQRGGLYETTLKQLGRDDRGRQMLYPRSSDPRHQTPIRPDAVGAETIEIIGVVVGKFETVPVSPIQART